MYVMKVDGQPFYAPTFHQPEYQVLAPNLKQEINTAGSLSFTLPPGHVMRGSIHKVKSVITVEQDGAEIFRGRVTEETVDTYNQKECYCDGDLSFLSDSMQGPYTYDGNAKDFFRLLIDKHNEQVEEGKRFTVGMLTALKDDDTVEMESVDYKDTLGEIRFVLVNEFEGYLRTRYEDGVRYIDYIKDYDDVCTQKIEFGVNLIDLDGKIDTGALCTILIPLGKRDSNNKAVTIASVNGGSDRIESAEAIERYGRVCKTYNWYEVEDPAELLEKGREKLAELTAVETLTLKAIDLHLLNVDVDRIRVGSKVRLISKPHGLDKEELCTSIDIDLENPENTTYTFGKPAETLSSGMNSHSQAIDRQGRNSNSLYKHTMDTIELKVGRDELISAINMSPERIKISSSLIELDGPTVVAALAGVRIDVSHIDTYSIYGSEGDFSMLFVGGNSATWNEQTVVTEMNGLNVTTSTIPYVDHNGANKYFSVVTAVSLRAPTTTTLSYLGG